MLNPRFAGVKVLGSFLLLASTTGLAQESRVGTPEIAISASVQSSHHKPQTIVGTLKFSGLSPANARCLLIPINDPDRLDHTRINQQLKMVKHKTWSSKQAETKTTITHSDRPLKQVTPYLYIIEDDGSSLTLNFRTDIAQDRGRPAAVFLDDFLPVPLPSCEGAPLQRPQELLFTGSVSPSEGFRTISLLGTNPVAMPHFAMALVKGLQKSTYNINGYEVSLYLNGASLDLLRDTIKSTMTSLVQWLGPLPSGSLHIVQSDELESFLMPGIVAINRPRQSLFDSLQSQWLNWSHWAMTTLLTYQWFIPQMQSTKADDLWFFQGLVDFLTAEALQTNSIRSNLFNVFDLDFSILSMTYRDSQNITAALLENYGPFATLTDENLNTQIPFASQHPLLYIRQSMALRHMAQIAGLQNFMRFLHKFRNHMSSETFKPHQFLEEINALPSPFSGIRRQELTAALTTWWTKSGWPDYSVKKIKSSPLADQKWLVEVEIDAKGPFNFPVEVDVVDKGGLHKRVLVKPGERSDVLVGSIITQFEADYVTVDPDRYVYDRNRFNNSTEGKTLEFFPGSASTLRDDRYTAVWLPYMQRRPGEKFSLGIEAMILRYIHDELTLRGERQTDGKSGFLIQRKDKFPQWGLGSELLLNQNFEGFRETKAVLSRAPLIPFFRPLSVSLNLRQRRIAGQPDTMHATYAATAMLSNSYAGTQCQFDTTFEYEEAPKNWSKHLVYQRRTASFQNYCKFLQSYGISNRIFYGDLSNSKESSNIILFKPQNLGEARIRLELNTPRPEHIVSLSNDLYMPFAIPLPSDSLILNKQIKWRMFYDYGRAERPKFDLTAGGLGFLMPFGGDFVGTGALALTRISLLAVIYSRAGDDVSKKPSLLFDLTGEL